MIVRRRYRADDVDHGRWRKGEAVMRKKHTLAELGQPAGAQIIRETGLQNRRQRACTMYR